MKTIFHIPKTQNRRSESYPYSLSNFCFAGAIILLGVFTVYLVTSSGKTPYDYFVRLAQAFLDGRNYLTEGPSWLSELIPIGDKFYVVYPPGPAILLMPVVALFGQSFPQQLFAHFVGALSVVVNLILALQLTRNTKIAIWTAILTGFSTIIWFMSSVGSVWYLGQTVAALFTCLALMSALAKKHPTLTGVLLGVSILSRINLVAALPFFALHIIYTSKQRLVDLIYLGLGLIPFIVFYLLYNYARFGNVLENGYFLLPSVLNETKAAWFAHGVASPVYIIDNLNAAFLTFPKILSGPPYIQPSWAGLAIWITTPAFIFALRANLKDRLVRLLWVAVILVFLSVAVHGGTGWAQFGYRFAVDLYPFLIPLTLLGVARDQLRWYHWLLLFAGVVVNLWGVVWINKFGWVGY